MHANAASLASRLNRPNYPIRRVQRRPLRTLIQGFATILAVLATSIAPADGGELDDARARAAEAAEAYAFAESELTEVTTSIQSLETEIGTTETEFAALQGDISALAIDRYMRAGGPPGMVDVAYASSGHLDLNLAAKADALIRAAAGYERDSLDKFVGLQAELVEHKVTLADHLARQEEINAELLAWHEEVFAELRVLEEADRKRRAAEERERRATTARQAAASDTSGRTIAASVGSWVCPVAGPAAFSDTWGAARSGGRRHKGVDMMAANGTPLVAPVSGSVRHTQNRLGGLAYYLSGDDGNLYYGAHLSSFGASGSVSAGEIIGYVGDTGNARGIDHLHFEIKAGGTKTVNPTPTVRKHC